MATTIVASARNAVKFGHAGAPRFGDNGDAAAGRTEAMSNRWTRYVKRLVRSDNPLLRPFRRHLRNPSLWRLNQRSVARGIAVGFFFGILTPVAQILFSTIGAIALRGNVMVAAASTLITNPLTAPFIYFLAYRIGLVLTGRASGLPSHAEVASAPDVEATAAASQHALEVGSWWQTLLDWISAVGPPLLVGAVALAVSAALAGYLIVNFAWIVAASLGMRLGQARDRRAAGADSSGERPR